VTHVRAPHGILRVRDSRWKISSGRAQHPLGGNVAAQAVQVGSSGSSGNRDSVAESEPSSMRPIAAWPCLAWAMQIDGEVIERVLIHSLSETMNDGRQLRFRDNGTLCGHR